MTGDTSRREKALSVFLSTLMVLSVLAMGMAGFAGSAAAASQGDTDSLADGEGYIFADPANASAPANHTVQVQSGSDLGNLNDSSAANLTVSYGNSVDFANVNNASGAPGSNTIGETNAGLNLYVNDTEIQSANVTFSDNNDQVDINVTEDVSVSSGDVVTLELGVNGESIGNPSESSTDVDVSVSGGSGTADFNSGNNNALTLAMGEGPIEVDQGSTTYYWNTLDRGIGNATDGDTVTITSDLDETLPTQTSTATVGASNVIIEGSGSPVINVSGYGTDVINFNGNDNITVDSLTIEGDGLGNNAINTGASANSTISGNIFQNFQGAVTVDATAGNSGDADTFEISSNTFTDDTGGAVDVDANNYADAEDTITIQSNDITLGSGGHTAIAITGGATSGQVTISPNTIEGVSGDTDTGIQLNTGADVDIDGGTINATDTAVASAGALGSFLNVTNSEMTNLDSYGLNIQRDTTLNVDGISVDSSSGATAVHLRDGGSAPTSVDITNSDINATDIGVDLGGSGTDDFNLTSNSITNAGTAGLLFTSSTSEVYPHPEPCLETELP